MSSPDWEKVLTHIHHAVFAFQIIVSIIYLMALIRLPYLSLISGFVVRAVFITSFKLAFPLLLLSTFSLLLNLVRGRWSPLLLLILGLEVVLVTDFSIFAQIFSLSIIVFNLSTIRPALAAFWCMVLLCGVEILSLFYLISRTFSPNISFQALADLVGGIHDVTSLLSPLLIFFFLFFWVFKPAIFPLLKEMFGRGDAPSRSHEFDKGPLARINHRYLLALVLVLAVLTPFYPYTPGINREMTPTSMDHQLYLQWMTEVETDWRSAFSLVQGTRPFLLLLMNVVARTTGLSSHNIVLFLPSVLNPLLALSVYFMVSKGLNDKIVAALSSLFTVIGPHTPVLMYSYNLANVLGLSLIFVSLGLFMDASNSKRPVVLVLSILSFTLVGYIHPWTMYQYYAAFALATLIGLLNAANGPDVDNSILPAISLLVAVFVLEIVRNLVLYFILWVPLSLPAISNPLQSSWTGFYAAVLFVYGGLLSNTILQAASVIGIWMLDCRTHFSRLLLCLVAISALTMLFMDRFWMNRLLLNLPFGVFTSYALVTFTRNTKIDLYNRIALSALVILILTVNTFLTLANLI